MISTLIALPYEIARLPLALVDNGLSSRLPETSGPRATLHRVIGSADKLAGAVLSNPGIAQRGADRIERTDMLRAAVRLEHQADAQREMARETAAEGRQRAAAQRAAAQEKAASGLDEADAVEARGKQEARAKAAKTAATKKKAAAKRAATRTAAVEQGKAQVESAAEAKKRATHREAKAELEDARQSKQEAAETRADADRLDDLTEAKKQERQQD